MPAATVVSAFLPQSSKTRHQRFLNFRRKAEGIDLWEGWDDRDEAIFQSAIAGHRTLTRHLLAVVGAIGVARRLKALGL